MSALSNLSKASAGQTRGAVGLFKKRWLHGSLKRQGVQMPALSPMMTEGTITKWKKKEGEAFAAGDVLLQIETDLYVIDVEAHAPGILGKILVPDGATNVPIEQTLALVAKDSAEYAMMQNQPLTPPYNPIPIPPSISANPMSSAGIVSPKSLDGFRAPPPLSSPRTPSLMPRTPSLFEMHTMGHGQRSAHVGGPKGRRIPRPLNTPTTPNCRTPFAGPATAGLEVPPCPSPRIPLVFQQQLQQDVATTPLPSTPLSAMWPRSATVPSQTNTGPSTHRTGSSLNVKNLKINTAANAAAQAIRTSTFDDDKTPQVDGAALRRMIVSNLASKQTAKTIEIEQFI